MKHKIKLGPLIEGTLRKQDTIPAMMNECFRRGISYAKVINDATDQWPDHELSIGRALQVIASGIPGGPNAVIAIPDHKWWTEDLDNGQGWTNHEENEHVWDELVDLLNEDLAGATFGTNPYDSACLGYWAQPNDDTRGQGVEYAWEKVNFGILMRHVQHKRGGPEVFFQMGDDMDLFQREIGAVDFVWMNDPQNTEGRVFKTIEEHYDAIMEPYFNND